MRRSACLSLRLLATDKCNFNLEFNLDFNLTTLQDSKVWNNEKNKDIEEAEFIKATVKCIFKTF